MTDAVLPVGTVLILNVLRDNRVVNQVFYYRVEK